MVGGDVSRDEKRMRRIERLLRWVKGILTHKSKGFNDMVYIATAIVSTVVVAIIGVYISAQIYDVTQLSSNSPFNTAIQIMNATYPLLIVVAIGIIAGIILTYLLGGFGVGAGGEKGGEK